jgi:hypothetical protein
MNQGMWGACIISALVLLQFSAVCFLVLWREVPSGSREAALVLLGSLANSGTMVVAYWVGSSAGSSRKDATISKLTETP